MIPKQKVVIVAIYFGKAPSNIQVWLDSCGWNASFNWLLIIDWCPNALRLPKNVEIKQSGLSEIKKILGDRLNVDVSLNHAYKLCDYRPLYWILLEYWRLKYDYWGHCDVDVIFGNLEKFLASWIEQRRQRILGLGHLSIYINNPIAKLAFLLPGSQISWDKTRCTEKNLGFDEHHGVNNIWKTHKLDFIEADEIVADIDPNVCAIRIIGRPLQPKKSILFASAKGVYLGWFDKHSVWKVTEYAYVHFQKRKLLVDSKYNDEEFYVLLSNKLVSVANVPNSKVSLYSMLLNEPRLKPAERLHLTKQWAKKYF